MQKTHIFTQKSKNIHNNKYNYSKVKYINAHTKITIICPEHGEFEQVPSSHLKGCGCPKCGKIKISSNKESFVKRSIEIHGNKYDYSKVNYTNRHTKVTIICPEHGEFEQTPNSHYVGSGCRKCANNEKHTTESFIQKSKEIHRDKYDYSKVKYVNAHTKVIIICPIHGEFEQKASSHINNKNGCLKCTKHSNSSFVQKSIEIHGNKYDYSKVNYKNNHDKVIIICPEHGEFEQFPSNHLRGNGCLVCSISDKSNTSEGFIQKAIEIHGKYDYSKINYKNRRSKVIIICPEHGEFEQTPDNHLEGKGCNVCPTIVSSGHQEIIDFISSIGFANEINNRNLLNPYELDIYIPEKKLAIEYNGLYWHSYDQPETTEERMRHKYKCGLCEDKNIRLIQINENEWRDRREIVESVLKSKLGISNRIFARKCKTKELSNQEYKEFMNKYHLQGHKGASVKIGLYYQDELVSAMSFNKHPKHEWEITRFASKLGLTIVGGASKVFKCFIKHYDPQQILTYADRRYSDGNLYKQLGFKFDGFTSPNYFYIKNKKIFSRQQFQKHKLKKRLEQFSPELTEAENMFNNGYRRLWDAGHYKFLYRSK